MFDASVQKIFASFNAAGVKAYIVGGAVRNFYLGSPVEDIDFAVECSPDRTFDILKNAQIRAIPTGIDHGTITAVVNNENFEITSFRKDIETDGRHAVTIFGGTLEDDARRRDFTMNALYFDENKVLIDPLGCRTDLENRILRFVGDAGARVQEDYLRILRFFRFLAQYSLHADEQAVRACTLYAAGLEKISAERIGAEMRKLLAGDYSYEAMDRAKHLDVLGYVLDDYDAPHYQNWSAYFREFDLAQLRPKDWRVEAVIASHSIPKARWRLSNRDADFMEAVKKAFEVTMLPAQMGEKFGEYIGFWALEYHASLKGAPVNKNDMEAMERGAAAVFPLNGNDLKTYGLEGVALGDQLERLKNSWRLSDYSLDKKALLDLVRQWTSD